MTRYSILTDHQIASDCLICPIFLWNSTEEYNRSDTWQHRLQLASYWQYRFDRTDNSNCCVMPNVCENGVQCICESDCDFPHFNEEKFILRFFVNVLTMCLCLYRMYNKNACCVDYAVLWQFETVWLGAVRSLQRGKIQCYELQYFNVYNRQSTSSRNECF